MNTSAASVIFIGVLIIVSRGPLIVFPLATRDVYLKMMSTNNRARVFGLFVLAIAVFFILANRGVPGAVPFFMLCLGGFMAGLSLLFMLVFVSVWRLVAVSVMEAMDPVMLRGLGVLAMFIGGLFIYLGLRAFSCGA